MSIRSIKFNLKNEKNKIMLSSDIIVYDDKKTINKIRYIIEKTSQK